MSKPETTWSPCRECGRLTNHLILSEHTVDSDPESYHERDKYQLVRCLGCDTVGFRHQNDDYENVREDQDGEAFHSTTVTIYPAVIRNHRKLVGVYYIPAVVRKIYHQTLSALSEKSHVLASVGLRATIEAVCNHLNISGNSLEKRIDQLYKGGHVSNGDKNRLHAIRFLGNDAAHEIREPKESDLLVALQIVEHMLNSIFILPKQARSLDILIETYGDFLTLLKSCITSQSSTEAISLAAILGRQRRQVGQHLDEFEGRLRSEIESGAFTDLKLTHIQNVGGKDIQLYQMTSHSTDDLDAE